MFANQPSFKYLLLIGDIVTLLAAALVALHLSAPDYLSAQLEGPVGGLVFATVIGLSMLPFLFMFFVRNLYKRQTFRSRYRHFTRATETILISTVLLVPVFVVFGWPFFSVYGRNFLLYFLPIAILGDGILRLLLVRFFVFTKGEISRKRRLLLVGSDDAARNVVDAFDRDAQSPFEIVGIVDDYKEKGERLFEDRINQGRLEDLSDVLNLLRTDEILIAIDNAPYSRLVHIVEECLATGCIVRVFSDRLKVLAERLGAELYAEGIPVVMLSQIQPSIYARSVRRIIDVALSFATLIVLAPLFLLVCAGIKISSPGPVIFRQTRIGRDGRSFDFYKFRSMHVGESQQDHQAFVESFIKGDGDDTQEQELQVFKIQDDPRIFPFGRFIRRTSLDEFPQLINVLKGDMGLVGPRPCLPYEWDAYEEWHKERLSVLPGCTGLWQVLGRSTVSFEDMVIMDLYYISNYSLFQDARILYKTIPAIFFAKGGY